jgi:hypothetical protein
MRVKWCPWPPRAVSSTSRADLQAAVDRGLIGESHYLDLKEMPRSKAGNLRLVLLKDAA